MTKPMCTLPAQPTLFGYAVVFNVSRLFY